jgi:hypothetical protein
MNIKHYSAFATGCLCLAGALSYLLGTAALRASDAPLLNDGGEEGINIGSADSGAYIIYSTPIRDGKSANFLTQDRNKKLGFSKQAGPKLIVIDLGRTYDLGSFHLLYKNPVNVELYVLEAKPSNGDWTSVLSQKPDFVKNGGDLDADLRGHTGRYIVFVASSDPGLFYGLYITGVYHPGYNDHFGNGGFYSAHNDDTDQTGSSGGSGPVGEPPIPRNDYNPPVNNPSP